MRIISGRLKGRKLVLPKTISFRPALGLVRKALFDTIRFKITPDQRFLDLFGGSGSIGLEAYSQGIDYVWINELDRTNFSFLKKNIENMGLSETITALNSDYLGCLDRASAEGVSFDYIYCAPPYAKTEYYKKTIERVREKSGLLTLKGMLIVECLKDEDFVFKGFRILRDHNYGSTRVIQLELDPARSVT